MPHNQPSRVEPRTAKLIARYTPRTLDPQRWALAEGPVRALLTACEAPYNRTVDLASALTAFLNSAVWAGTEPPDLPSLLTEKNITAHCELLRNKEHLHVTRAHLRLLARAAGVHESLPPTHGKLPAKKRYASVLLVEGGLRPISSADLLRAWVQATGNSLFGNPLPPVREQWARLGCGTAARRDVSTVDTSKSLAATTEVNHRPEKANVTSQAQQGKRGKRPAKPMSPTAAAAHARKARKAAAEARQPLRVVEEPPEAPSEAIGLVVETYKPMVKKRTVWSNNAELGKRLVIGYRPSSPGHAKTVCSYVSRFLSWYIDSAHRHAAGYSGDVIAAEELLNLRLVEHFVVEEDMPDRARSTTRSHLRRALLSLTDAPKPFRGAHHRALAPYTPDECATFVAVATQQPTSVTSSNLCFIVGLALGAGLDAADIASLDRTCFKSVDLDGTDVFTVTVPTGRPRTVPVRHQYRPLVERALALHAERVEADTDALIGRRGGKNPMSATISRARLADGQPLDMSVRRLRNTWLVAAMCANVPLADLMRAAGLESSRTFAELLPFCPPTDPAAIDHILATLAPVLDEPVPEYARRKQPRR